MENKEQDRALQTPSEANRNKHMNYLARKEDNENGNNEEEEKRIKHDADSGNDSTNEMLQKEGKIDPGNEHTHQKNEKNEFNDGSYSSKHDADSGGDGTGSMGPKPE